MGLISELLSFLRTEEDGAHVSDAKIDPGDGANVTARHFADAGDDSHPLPGDFVATVEAPGSGGAQVTGYLDTVNEPQAAAGEKRIYSRDSDGAVMAVVWLKADGTIELGSPDDFVALAAKVDAEIQRIWDLFANWTPVPQDGGAALKTAASAASAAVQSVASQTVKAQE